LAPKNNLLQISPSNRNSSLLNLHQVNSSNNRSKPKYRIARILNHTKLSTNTNLKDKRRRKKGRKARTTVDEGTQINEN